MVSDSEFIVVGVMLVDGVVDAREVIVDGKIG